MAARSPGGWTRRTLAVWVAVWGLLALHAAAVDARIAAVVTWQAPLSYHSLIVEHPAWPASAYLFGVLNHYDLPDLMAMVAPRPLLVAEPVDRLREHLSEQEASRHTSRPRQIYSLLNKHPGAAATITIGASIREPQGIAHWLSTHFFDV